AFTLAGDVETGEGREEHVHIRRGDPAGDERGMLGSAEFDVLEQSLTEASKDDFKPRSFGGLEESVHVRRVPPTGEGRIRVWLGERMSPLEELPGVPLHGSGLPIDDDEVIVALLVDNADRGDAAMWFEKQSWVQDD